MGRIFISAAHGGKEGGKIDPGAIAGGTTEAREMILLRDAIVTELRSRNLQVLSVPDDLSAENTITWINSRARSLDIAIEIHANAAPNPSVRGASVFYIANNNERRNHAELILVSLLKIVPQLPSRGNKPDSESGTGGLLFCRRTSIPALQMQVIFLSSPEDRLLLQNRRRNFALGIAEGLIAWNQIIDSGTSPNPTYTEINININGQNYPEKGILVDDSSYIPIDLIERLRVDLGKIINIPRITYRKIVYIKARELQQFKVSVQWDAATRTIKLRSALVINPGQIDKIISNGNTTEAQLKTFLNTNNENALNQFPDLPQLYREEAAIEGINYDIAFAQMCFETGFLRFGGDIKPEQNNFAGLAAIGSEAAAFESARIGVRAHIQHLKAYASTESLKQEIVDPRFRFVPRGAAQTIEQLSGRWSADLDYGAKIIGVLEQLYQSSGLL
jgi:N-acetylmuramoyl-L-alanine amidase/Mannosyl-glycoprotein endo-beta-N-acetylglucosaminidase